MAGIGEIIELTDQMTSPLLKITDTINLVIDAFQEMRDVSGHSVNISAIKGVQEQMGAAAAGLNQMQVSFQMENTVDNLGAFAESGIRKYRQEMTSVNQMLERMTQNQQKTVSPASPIGIFPNKILSNIQSVNTGIQKVWNRIRQIKNSSIDDIVTDTANTGMEILERRLQKTLWTQNDLTDAMGRMDITDINNAYGTLHPIMDTIDRYIKEAVSLQIQFNQCVQQGESAIGKMKEKIVETVSSCMDLKGIEQVFGVFDTLAGLDSKIKLMNDEMQSTQELQDMIFLSAQRSGNSYADTVAALTKIRQKTGDIFDSNQEAIQFVENMNKSFSIAGATQQEMSYALLRMTQSLNSGVLGSEALNAVFAAAPNMLQIIADYLHVPAEQLWEMASNGEITADIIKNAMLNATDAINTEFATVPKTFAQIGAGMENIALMIAQPVLTKLNEIANSENFEKLVTGVTNTLVVVSGIVLQIFDLVAQAAGFILDNWSVVGPFIMGAAVALGIYVAALHVYNAVQTISNGIKHAYAIASGAATAAQYGFNAALLACPLTWIVISIIAAIAAAYGLVAIVNELAGSTVSATGIICGVIAVGAAFVGNIFNALIKLAIGVFVVLWNFIADFVNFFSNVFNDPIGSIARLFYDLGDNVLSLLESLASAIDTVFGSNLADSVRNWRDSLGGLGGLIDEVFGEGEEIMAHIDASEWEKKLKRFEYGDAWNTGYSFGKGIDGKLEEVFNRNELQELLDKIEQPPYPPNPGDGSGSIPEDVGQIKNNTEKIANGDNEVTMSAEDLEYIRSMAEKSFFDKFISPKVTLTVQNQNTISSELDLDGFMNKMADDLELAVAKGAEGVHI